LLEEQVEGADRCILHCTCLQGLDHVTGILKRGV
jgi:hypothetical protein